METTTINKAEALRVKQATETITNVLNNKLIAFKERFLTAFVKYRFDEFDRYIRIQEIEIASTQKPLSQGQIEYKKQIIAGLEAQKALVSTNTLKFINEAQENYTTKFNNLVASLVKFGVRAYPLHIEQIGSATSDDFAFLITHNAITVHARVIFACGAINAPHYRFITTKRAA